MATPKTLLIYGLMAKLEASYAGGGTVAGATDGVQLAEWGEITIAYGDDGLRPAPPSSLGYQKRAAASGPTASGRARVEVRGGGAAYSASVTPKNTHVLLQAAGFTPVLTATAGSERYDYALTNYPSVAFASAVMEPYGRGEKYPVSGVYADVEIGADGPGIVFADFAWQGLLGTITDTDPPAITYPTVVPPKSTGASLLTLNAITDLKLRSWRFRLGREIAARLDQNSSSGHAGFSPGRVTPQLEVTIETPVLSSLNAYSIFATGGSFGATIAVGSTQYNRFSLITTDAQIMAPPVLGADGPVSTTTLTLQLNDITLKFD